MKMSTIRWFLIPIAIWVCNSAFGSKTLAEEELENLTPDAMSQVTNVSELRDISANDWAFEALRSLVERYGCLVGYPNLTFRGDRALSRWEFAAGLNACINAIERLLQENVNLLQADIDKLKRLVQEFETELAALSTRVDNLEARVSLLEDHQFSTTTKLHGNAIFAVANAFGGDANNQTVLQYRANLSLITSFTGKDLLLLAMYAGNVPLAQFDGQQISTAASSFDLPGVVFDTPGISRTIKASTAEGTLSSQFGANTNNKLQILAMGYSFPVGDALNIAVASSLTTFQLYAPTLNPYLDDFDSGTGAISIFGEYNPLYALSGGGTGAILNYKIVDNLKLTAGYLADGLFANNPSEGDGLFNGGYGVLGQLTWNVSDNFAIAGLYTNEYAPPGRFGFNYNGLGVTGTAVANTLAGQDVLFGSDRSPVITNGYGVQFNWQPSPQFSLSGWFSTFYSRLIGEGDGSILTYALTFAFPDLGKEGNLLGLVVGAEPYLTAFNGGNPQDFEVDVPWHIEAFYRYRLTDNIYITPGVIWLLAPNQDSNNPDAFIATLRTTFQF